MRQRPTPPPPGGWGGGMGGWREVSKIEALANSSPSGGLVVRAGRPRHPATGLVALAAFGPTLYPVDPYRMAIAKRLRPPSARAPAGHRRVRAGRPRPDRPRQPHQPPRRPDQRRHRRRHRRGPRPGGRAGRPAGRLRHQRRGRRDAGLPRLPAGASHRGDPRPQPRERDDRDRHPPGARLRPGRAGRGPGAGGPPSSSWPPARWAPARSGSRRSTCSGTSPRP